MVKLIKQIKNIPKSYFALADLRKISRLDDASLKVALGRLVKNEEIARLTRGVYTIDAGIVDTEKLALELYNPSYLSFEWALAKYGILSQQPLHLTLATAQRSKIIKTNQAIFYYHHLQPKLYFGYIQENGLLAATPEKALIDQAYLSLNGYAKFDVKEMNLEEIDKITLENYLREINNEKLNKLFKTIKILN